MENALLHPQEQSREAGSCLARNLLRPVTDMKLPVRIETRSGDTPPDRRKRQREDPPHFLLTTPESLALLISLPDAATIFAGLRCIVIDEAHALAGTKRGDQLALCVARLTSLAPEARRVGLPATVSHKRALFDYVRADRTIEVEDSAAPEIDVVLPQGRLPWSEHMGLDAAPEVLERILQAGMTIVFINTRAQAELMFQALWKLNTETLPIAIHHGSLDIAARCKVEAAMAAGGLTDLGRVAGMLKRIGGRITHIALSRVSPLAVPVLLEIGRESVRTGDDEDRLLEEAEAIIAEATGDAPAPERTPVAGTKAARPQAHPVHRVNVARKAKQERATQGSLFGDRAR